MLLSKKIKIHISEQDAATLEFMQGKCRGLYNWLVMRLRGGEEWGGVYATKKTLQESKVFDPELEQVYGKLLHEVYFRLDGAMRAFFRRVKAGETPGFPRVRPRHCFFTLCYPAMYIKVNGKTLLLPTGGKGKNKRFPTILATLTEAPPEGFKEVAISRDARGNYFASFVSERAEEIPTKDGVVAFDFGIKTLATGVNEQGRVYHIGGFKGGRWYNKQLDKIRSKRAKCKKKSRRSIRLSKTYKRIAEKKRNKEKDSFHKASHLIAYKLVERTVVVGDLSQRQMVTKQHIERNKSLNRAVFNDWGLYTFLQMLAYKCQLNGKELVAIDEKNTSKMCSGCGNLQNMPLWKRTYCCVECGLTMDRDDNSAVNILMRFLARLGPHTGDPVRCTDVFSEINTFRKAGHGMFSMEWFRLDGQNAFVTGAGSGIGQGIAIGLAQAGANVACFDVSASAGLPATINHIQGLGRHAVRLTGDVTSAADLHSAIATSVTELGSLDVAINCAGIANATPAEAMPLDQWQRMLDINLTGVFLSCQAEAHVMLPRKRGSIINIASMSGVIVNRGLTQAHYNSSKAAVIHLSKSLAMEWGDRGIRVNSISPGYTLTPMNQRPEVAEQLKIFAADTPLGRIATVDEMIGPAVFLASQASAFCTGVNLLVDGGFVCW